MKLLYVLLGIILGYGLSYLVPINKPSINRFTIRTVYNPYPENDKISILLDSQTGAVWRLQPKPSFLFPTATRPVLFEEMAVSGPKTTEPNKIVNMEIVPSEKQRRNKVTLPGEEVTEYWEAKEQRDRDTEMMLKELEDKAK